MLPIELDEAKSYLTKLEAQLRAEFRNRDKRVDKHRDLYFMDHHKGRRLEAGETQITTGKATNAVDLTVGILSSNPMRIRAYGLNESADAETDATNVEKFLKGLLYVNNERQETTIEIETITDQVRDAWGCIFSYWDPDVPITGSSYAELPATIERVDIKNIYYKRGGPRGGYRLFVRSCMRTARDIEDEWGIKISGYEMEDRKDKKVKYIDYWGWTKSENGKWVVENAILADNKTWIKEPDVVPGYSDLPFTLFPGRLTNSEQPENNALGILYPIESQIEDYETQLIHHRRLTDLYSSLPPVITTTNGQEPPGVDAVIGKVVILREGEKFEFPHWPGSPPDLARSIQRLDEEIQQGTYPNVQYGGDNSSSGFGISLMTESGRIRLQQFQKNLERSWAIVFRKILSLAAFYAPNQYLPVYGNLNGQPYMLNIMGSDMRGFRVDVEVKPQFPQEESRNVTMATQIKAQGLLSDKSIQERYLGVDYPDIEMDRKLLEAAMQNPDLLRAKIMKALQEYDPEAMAMIQPPPQEQTMQQNNRARATVGKPPEQRPSGELPPSAVMPQEMAGIGPPQSRGMPPPGQQLPPNLMQMLNQIMSGPGVR